ncbi:hypothetical protein DFH07DRAFT_972738 [Mycena maculata]|uniref:Uncharacterized protein n=1 Tax=Mycena maculata TaxID=230809 RepID=A0AAD7MK48_9AGAR|nr:hypothetical protein DFH07DRAFT_972738 [Mycena maculata]
MRAFTSLPLDDDLVDRVLTFSPNFCTLYAIILVCKSIHSVFSARPASITRAVAYNICGPALPDAVRAVRASCSGVDVPLLTDADLQEILAALSAEEKHKLESNAYTVQRFEDIFGLWYKDRMSRTSTLLPREAHRFHRALHRIILYSEKFSPSYYWMDRVPADEEELLESVQITRKEFISAYSTEELLEMQAAVAFLTQVLVGVFGDACGTQIQWALSAGPASILEAFVTRSSAPIQRHFDVDLDQGDDDFMEYDEYFTNAFSLSPWGVILDDTPGENEICVHCRRLGGIAIWNENGTFLR